MKHTTHVKTPSETIQAIFALDFEQLKSKMMHKSGYGWTREEADRHELEYKRFLALLVKYPNETIVPTVAADEFWHSHILDTMRYAKDCQNVFGYFLHHNPYIGLRGEEDAGVQQAAADTMRRLYAQEFGTAKSTDAAYCGKAEAAYCGKADAAYCGAAAQDRQEAAYCGAAAEAKRETAYCGAAKQAAYCGVSAVAYCGKASDESVAQDAAYCGVAAAAYCGAAAGKAESKTEEAAYCGVASAAYCGASTAKPVAKADEVAYCGAANATAYCGAAVAKAEEKPAEAAYCGVVAAAA